jgi:hypothetical protein
MLMEAEFTVRVIGVSGFWSYQDFVDTIRSNRAIALRFTVREHP